MDRWRQNRFHQALLLGSLLPLCWLLMQVVHEAGHVLAAWLSGGEVERVVLHPLAISRTDLARNPQPLFVAWAGGVVGSAFPMIVWMIVGNTRWAGTFLLRFFAGFCLIANGAYLAGGSFAGVGDAGDLLRHGGAMWHLWLFGLATIPAGLALWNGLGPHFGYGTDARQIPRGLSYTCLAALGLLIGLEVLISAYVG